MKAALWCEQLLQDVPGGIGTYVRALLDHLPAQGVAAEPVVALHRTGELFEAGLSQARRLKLPRQAVHRAWERGAGPDLDGDADVVHAPSLAIPARKRCPMVVTVHDTLWRDFPDAYPKRGVEFHERMLEQLDKADVVLTPSKATAASVAGHRDVRVVPLGTDWSAPEPGERDKILEDLGVRRPYVLWNATVEPRKNPEGVVHGFVEAVQSGVPRGDELMLYLAGPPGWWKGDVAEFLQSRSMSDRVRRIGEQPRRVREALYSGAEAFLFPSLAEGFGLPVLDAMACGAPVVTSDRSSLPEVAGSAALLCDPDDEHSIGSALAKVLRDPELAADLRRLGRQRAAEFTWERTANLTAQAYREACE